MRALLVLLVLSVPLAAPLAVGEEWQPRAGGLTMGLRSGVTGVQFGEDDGVGVRYWVNATAGGEPLALVLTTCYLSGSGSIEYCERHRVAA